MSTDKPSNQTKLDKFLTELDACARSFGLIFDELSMPPFQSSDMIIDYLGCMGLFIREFNTLLLLWFTW